MASGHNHYLLYHRLTCREYLGTTVNDGTAMYQPSDITLIAIDFGLVATSTTSCA